jgi:hypothetical protein
MPTVINGLPAHILLVHAVVVLIPLTGLAVVLHAAWPVARRRLGIVTPILALVSLVLVPVTTHAGKFLEKHILKGQDPNSELAKKIRHHAVLGDQLLPWALVLFVVAAAIWVLGRWLDGASVPFVTPAAEGGTARSVPAWLTVVAVAVAVAIAVVGIVEVVRIGDSGSKSVWGGTL